MVIPDVNVLVSGHRPESPLHDRAYGWMKGALGGENRELVGFTVAVVTGYIRVVTNPRVFAEPTPIDHALRDIETLMEVDNAVRVEPGLRFWPLYADLCRDVGARGTLTADAAHAAAAIEAGATWVTFDRDFTRFSGLRYRLL